jgi:hypothetical protein
MKDSYEKYLAYMIYPDCCCFNFHINDELKIFSGENPGRAEGVSAGEWNNLYIE